MLRLNQEISNGRISYLYRDGSFPLIFLHGLGGSGNNWIKLEPFLDRRFALYFVDLAGHGRTQISNYDHTIEMQIAMLHEFFSKLKLENFALVGNSYGGWVSLRYAVRYDSTGILILVDSAGINKTVGEGSEELVSKFVDRVMVMNPHNNRETIENIVRHNADGTEKVSRDQLENITWPTMIIWGSEDKLIDPQYANLMHSAIRGSEIHVIEGAGHTPHVSHPNEVAKDITSFVSKHLIE